METDRETKNRKGARPFRGAPFFLDDIESSGDRREQDIIDTGSDAEILS
jgi:hypothetical protein